jgi:putative ABC transport system permease protein
MQLDTVWQDLRHGLRSWRSRPLLYALALTALALGIGANTTIFSVVRNVLLRSLPYPDPTRLVNLYEKSPRKNIARYFVSPSDYYDWRDRSRTLESFAGYWRNEANVTDTGHDPERIPAVSGTPSLTATLGLRMAAGRAISEAEGINGAPSVTLITYELWQRRYAADPSIFGKSIGINGAAATVVGILEPGVHFAGDAQVWNTLIPYRPRPTPRFMEAIARLRAGVSLGQARSEMDALARTTAAEFPGTNADWQIGVSGMYDDLVGPSRPALILLLVSVSLLLLIACANVASLLLAHASTRRHEVALRAALGAGSGRLVRQFFTESLLLACAGGAAGTAVALAGVRAVRAFGPANLPHIRDIGLSLPVLGYTLAVSLFTGLLFGMAPALGIRKPELAAAMNGSGRGMTGGRSEHHGRRVLVIAQVALSVTLANAAGLLIKSFARLTAVNPGFRTEHVLTANISLPQAQYADFTRVSDTFDRILSATRAMPGVKSAGTTTSLPLAHDLDYRIPFAFLALPAPKNLEDQTAWHRMVSTGLFAALGTPFLAGRDFNGHDTADGAPVVVINQSLARQYWPGGGIEYPIGQKLRVASGGLGPLGTILVRNPEVLGVVANIQYAALGKAAEPAIYFPSRQAPFYNVTLVVRTDASLAPGALIAGVRRKLFEIDSTLPLAHVRTMTEQLAESIAQPRFQTILLAAFSCLALLLGSIGIYGLLSYGVAIRTREIGIRAALGGRPADIRRLILGQGFQLVAWGLAFGMGASIATGRWLGNLLFHVKSADFATYAGVCALLAGVGLLAGYLPARTASNIDPGTALRES